MTADITTRKKHAETGTPWHTLTLSSAVLTLFLALLSIILGSRLSTLQTDFLKAKTAAATSEAASFKETEIALKSATQNLESTQQALVAEKESAKQLQRRLSAAMQDLEKTKADLAIANQEITEFKSAVKTPAASAQEPSATPASQPPAMQPEKQAPPPRRPRNCPAIFR